MAEIEFNTSCEQKYLFDGTEEVIEIKYREIKGI